MPQMMALAAAPNAGETALAATIPTSAESAPLQDPAMPFRFMDLPTELRVQIYEELFIVGKVLYKQDHEEQSDRLQKSQYYRKPSLAILGVSKEVKAEAEAVYLTK
jgi:hypothetical protein